MHLWYPIVESPLVCSELPIDRLFKWPNTPHLRWIRQVCPHTLIGAKDDIMVFERLCAAEHAHIMYTACVAQWVISDQKILRQADDLEK